MQLSTEQVEAVVQWMYEWEQLRNSAIPMRFREDFTKWLKLPKKPDESVDLHREVEQLASSDGSYPSGRGFESLSRIEKTND
jgi:hypothetical protein